MLSIACFITPHGFGHASRAAAVMEALADVVGGVRFDIVTTSPRWFFDDSVPAPFCRHPVETDLGMVQKTPLVSDPAATCRRLDSMLPFDDALVDRLARRLCDAGCRLVICDIAALGLAVARRAGIPGVLVENFTWDWIYAAYVGRQPGLQKHIDYLSALYANADLHVQAEPLCRAVPGAVRVGPIARPPRSSRHSVRSALGIGDDRKMVLVSMGGIPDRFEFLRRLPAADDYRIVVPGAEPGTKAPDHVVLLPRQSAFFHPDLLRAADVLIGKAGYSTVAEAYYAGIPFGYIARSDSPESPALEVFIKKNLPCRSISETEYASGEWMARLPELAQMSRVVRAHENGAVVVARLIRKFLGAK